MPTFFKGSRRVLTTSTLVVYKVDWQVKRYGPSGSRQSHVTWAQSDITVRQRSIRQVSRGQGHDPAGRQLILCTMSDALVAAAATRCGDVSRCFVSASNRDNFLFSYINNTLSSRPIYMTYGALNLSFTSAPPFPSLPLLFLPLFFLTVSPILSHLFSFSLFRRKAAPSNPGRRFAGAR